MLSNCLHSNELDKVVFTNFDWHFRQVCHRNLNDSVLLAYNFILEIVIETSKACYFLYTLHVKNAVFTLKNEWRQIDMSVFTVQGDIQII